MDIILILIPIALALGLGGLMAFVWSLKSGQFDDPVGNASRILQDDLPPPVIPTRAPETPETPVRDGPATPASRN